jgi:hypothetical protein
MLTLGHRPFHRFFSISALPPLEGDSRVEYIRQSAAIRSASLECREKSVAARIFSSRFMTPSKDIPPDLHLSGNLISLDPGMGDHVRRKRIKS